MRKGYVVPLVVLLAACASIVSKSNYPVTLSSNPSGAAITITKSNGEQVFTGTTPATVTLSAKKGFFSGENYMVRATLAGHSDATVQIGRGIDGWYFGNLLFGGLIGMLIVDPATGAMWKLDQNVVVNMSQSEPQADADATLRILTIDEIPAGYRQHLVRLK